MSGTYRDQMGASDSLELDLPMVVSHHECTEETKPRSPVRAASALNSQAISPAPSVLHIPTHICWVENANSCYWTRNAFNRSWWHWCSKEQPGKNIFSCHKGFLSLNYPVRHCKLRNNLVLLFLSYFTQKCKSLEDKKTKKEKELKW